MDPSGERTACSVLVVDSNAASREAIAELLREYGHRVYTAGCLQELDDVCHALADAPGLVFLDFHLYDGRGDEAAARLRVRWSDIFIVYFSCLHPEDDGALRAALRAPATALLFKPTSLEAILEVVRQRPGWSERRN